MRAMSRRGLMNLLSLAGLTTVARSQAALGAPDEWPGQPGRDGMLRLVVDVAVLGHTDAQNTTARIGDPHAFLDADARGDTFYVEGSLYPGNTIATPTHPTGLPALPQAPPRLNNEVVWDFKQAQPVGHWLSRGWVLFNGSHTEYKDSRGTVIDQARPQPRLLSEQTFVFGRFGADALSPEMIVTSGTENGLDPDKDTVTRAVTGGTGRFAHASGEVVQRRLGRNTSLLRSMAGKIDLSSPNYRFEFHLRLR
jgi:hypothetical protein